VSSTRKILRCAPLLAFLLLGAGCGGFNVGKSFSPIDLLLPGAGGLIKADPQPIQPGLDEPKPSEKPVTEIASL